MTVRPAKAEDVPAVLPMVGRECAMHEAADPARYGFVAGVESMYERWLTGAAADAQCVFLVAEPEGGGRLAGFLIGRTEQEGPIYRLRRFGFIHDVWVEPAYRNEGLGRRMVLMAVEAFARMGLSQVRLDVLAGNAAARGLFESCGFRVSTHLMLLELGDAAGGTR